MVLTNQSPQATKCSAWSPESPRGKALPETIAVFTPAVRRDFVETVRWGIRAAERKVKRRYFRARDATRGQKLAMYVLIHVIFFRPKRQTLAEWLEQCESWQQENNGQANNVCPPWPWDRGELTIPRMSSADILTQMHSAGAEMRAELHFISPRTKVGVNRPTDSVYTTGW